MQPGLLQVEKHRVDAVERAQAAVGQPPRRMARLLLGIGNAQRKLLLAAFFENPQNVAGLAERKLRERVERRQDAMQPRVLGRDGRGIDQAQRRAVRPVGLAVAVIFEGHRAVVVERRAPEHRAVVHHAVPDMVHGFLVAQTASLLRNAQVAGIDEADEFGGLVVQQDGGIAGIGRTFPEDWIARKHMCLALREAGGGIAAVAIRAAQHDVRTRVHRVLVNALMAFQAAGAFRQRFARRLINPVARLGDR